MAASSNAACAFTIPSPAEVEACRVPQEPQAAPHKGRAGNGRNGNRGWGGRRGGAPPKGVPGKRRRDEDGALVAPGAGAPRYVAKVQVSTARKALSARHLATLVLAVLLVRPDRCLATTYDGCGARASPQADASEHVAQADPNPTLNPSPDPSAADPNVPLFGRRSPTSLCRRSGCWTPRSLRRGTPPSPRSSSGGRRRLRRRLLPAAMSMLPVPRHQR